MCSRYECFIVTQARLFFALEAQCITLVVSMESDYYCDTTENKRTSHIFEITLMTEHGTKLRELLYYKGTIILYVAHHKFFSGKVLVCRFNFND